MYPVTLGFNEAVKRIETLLKNGHSAEALVTSVFTFEKTMRRSLKLAILGRGFSLKQSDRLIERKGFKELRECWDIFEKDHRPIHDLVGNDKWQFLPRAVEMRNRLVHGVEVFKLAECELFTGHVLKALQQLHTRIAEEYGRDPWSRMSGRRSPALQWVL